MSEASDYARMSQLAPNLGVPKVIPDSLKIFYPHTWLEASRTNMDVAVMTFEAQVVTACNRLGARPTAIGQIVIDSQVRAFVAYLRLQQGRVPATREEWQLPFGILQLLLLQMKFVEYRMEDVMELKRRLDANPAQIDISKALSGIKGKK